MNYYRQTRGQSRSVRTSVRFGVEYESGYTALTAAWSASQLNAESLVPRLWQQTARDSALRFVTIDTGVSVPRPR
jgi:hypothetical protein